MTLKEKKVMFVRHGPHVCSYIHSNSEMKKIPEFLSATVANCRRSRGNFIDDFFRFYQFRSEKISGFMSPTIGDISRQSATVADFDFLI
uniref:Uncharacterized protein n=1 Tax=Romanomermis culicivorax TaxID=13658 RepID=A0A915J8C4_ROMCU